MTDLDFIIALGYAERHLVGFLPAPTLRDRYVAEGTYKIIRDARRRRRGFLIHGPARPNRPTHIIQTAVELDWRLRGFARSTVMDLATQAAQKGSTELQLRCALTNPAHRFWESIGFCLHNVTPGGESYRRAIGHYTMDLTPLQIRSPGRQLWLPVQLPAIPQV